MTYIIKGLFVTLSITDTRDVLIVMLSVIMLGVVMLNVMAQLVEDSTNDPKFPG